MLIIGYLLVANIRTQYKCINIYYILNHYGCIKSSTPSVFIVKPNPYLA
ncbi:hypothetical protein PUND_a2578 [Pseudoalteromonas undina]|nr:hypothetical protein PUND_a2578 [Pseudoalteromonas undina]